MLLKSRVFLFIIFFISPIFQASSTKPSSSEIITNTKADNLKNEKLPILGSYTWTFHVGPIKQESTYIFNQRNIDYRMRGKVYTTNYNMQQISFDSKTMKWIGKTKENNFYVIFFKDLVGDKITMYKHKCEKNGLAECLVFPRPADNETKDHGWNTYARDNT